MTLFYLFILKNHLLHPPTCQIRITINTSFRAWCSEDFLKQGAAGVLPQMLYGSVLTHCSPVWFSNCTVHEKTGLQRVINTAEKINGCALLSEELYSSHCCRKVCSILKDTSHPAQHLFLLLPSGRRYRTIKARTNRLKSINIPGQLMKTQKSQTVQNENELLLQLYIQACDTYLFSFSSFLYMQYLYISSLFIRMCVSLLFIWNMSLVS